jgi:hypothetical protein
LAGGIAGQGAAGILREHSVFLRLFPAWKLTSIRAKAAGELNERPYRERPFTCRLEHTGKLYC